MKHLTTFAAWGALVLTLVLGASLLFGGKLAGSVIEVLQTDFRNGLKVAGNLVLSGNDNTGTFTLTVGGSNGTALSRVNSGTCYIQAYAATIAATSTATVECQGTAFVRTITTAFTSALTGITSSSAVQAELSADTAGTTVGGLVLTAAQASTTSGYITLRIYNATGGTFTWPTTGSATGTVSYFATQ